MAAEAAAERLDGVIRALEAPLAHAATPARSLLRAEGPTSNTSKSDYLGMVERAQDYIRAGMSSGTRLRRQRFSGPFALPPSLYRALRRINPAPYLSFLDFGAFQICCSSPEILVRVRTAP